MFNSELLKTTKTTNYRLAPYNSSKEYFPIFDAKGFTVLAPISLLEQYCKEKRCISTKLQSHEEAINIFEKLVFAKNYLEFVNHFTKSKEAMSKPGYTNMPDYSSWLYLLIKGFYIFCSKNHSFVIFNKFNDAYAKACEYTYMYYKQSCLSGAAHKFSYKGQSFLELEVGALRNV